MKPYLFNCEKIDLDKVIAVDTWTVTKNVDIYSLKSDVDKLVVSIWKTTPCRLNNLKSKVDQLDFDKYKTAPIDLKKLSNVADKYLMETNIVWYLSYKSY